MDRKNNVERLASICRRSWRPWRCGATGGGGLWLGRSGPERPWNWLTGTDASLDDLLTRLNEYRDALTHRDAESLKALLREGRLCKEAIEPGKSAKEERA